MPIACRRIIMDPLYNLLCFVCRYTKQGRCECVQAQACLVAAPHLAGRPQCLRGACNSSKTLDDESW